MGVYFDEKRKTYYFRTVEKNQDGEKKYITRRGFPTQRSAIVAEAEFKESAKKDKRILNKESNVTLDELYEEYRKYKSNFVATSTLVTNQNKYDNLISPYLGKKKIREITIVDIQVWKATLIENPKDYSSSYLRRAFSILNDAMRYGVKYGFINHNVIADEGTFEFARANKRNKKSKKWKLLVLKNSK